jgi:8-oxo-dGTP diphosphatase
MEKGIHSIGVAVVFLCHDGQGNILMQKRGQNCRDEQGRWDIGAGGVEFEDNVEATIKKEIKEEYGTEVINYEFLGYRDVLRKQGETTTHWVALDFKVLVDPKLVKNGEPHKFDEIVWFTKETLPKNIHSQWPIFYEKYKDKF